MGKSKKTGRRVWSLVLAFVLTAGTIVGILPRMGKIAKADDPTVTWDMGFISQINTSNGACESDGITVSASENAGFSGSVINAQEGGSIIFHSNRENITRIRIIADPSSAIDIQDGSWAQSGTPTWEGSATDTVSLSNSSIGNVLSIEYTLEKEKPAAEEITPAAEEVTPVSKKAAVNLLGLGGVGGFDSNYTVTFKVVNGKWNDGTSEDKSVNVDATTGSLSSDRIPAVGDKPNEGYMAGSWDKTPSTSVMGNETYTYTYAAKTSITRTVTFRVVNGSWDNGSTADKILVLTGYEGDTLKLAEWDIPKAGSNPQYGYQEGRWDKTPDTETEITQDTLYTYTYAAKTPITYTITFKVENGKWDDGTTANQTVTLTGYEGDRFRFPTNKIPEVGNKPNSGHKAGDWDEPPIAYANSWVTEDMTFTYKYIEADGIARGVTFIVRNGAWDDGTTTSKTVNFPVDSTDPIILTADQIPTAGTKPLAGYEAGSWDVIPVAGEELTNGVYTYTYERTIVEQTVTFKVVNGSWNDGSSEDRTVTLTGYVGDILKLTSDQIPSVGTKSADGYQEGNWDVTPDTETAISDDIIYTYTYSKIPDERKVVYQIVTFKVINGSWDDGKTDDKNVALVGYEGDLLYLKDSDIPSVGTKPADGYQAGSWDVSPSTETGITTDVSYTYTYVKKTNDDPVETYDEVPVTEGKITDITGTKEATSETNPFSTMIKNSKELASLLDITAEEKTEGVNVWLDIKEAENVPETDKTAILSTVGDSTVGVWLDANLFKKVGNGAATKVTELSGKIKVCVLLPEKLRGDGRTYEIVRVHDGKATVLSTVYDETANTLTFETDQFSTYAIIYKAAEQVTAAASTSDATTASAATEAAKTSPKTGDSAPLAVIGGIAFLMLLATAGIGISAKKHNIR